MKQILQNLKNGDITLAQIPVPRVKKGHLLIKSTKSLISLGTERMLLNFGKAGWLNKAKQQPDKVKQVLQKMKTDGLMPTVNAVFKKLDQPLPLGYSNSGVVIEVGEGVSGFKVGDRVSSNGNHAQIVCVAQNLCAKIPDSVSDTAACFTVVSSIALQGIRLIKPTLGETVAVMGLGLIGLLTCQILIANGCKVIGFDFDSQKVALANKFGVSAHNISDDVDPVKLAMNYTNENGVDAVIITASTTSNSPIEQAPQMCRKRGRVVLVGVTGLNISRDDFYKKEISFQVSCSYGPGRYETAYEDKSYDYPIGHVRWTQQRNFMAVLQLMADKKIVIDELVSKQFDLEQAEKAYEIVGSNANSLGIVLNYGADIDINERTIVLKDNVSYANADVVAGFIGAGNYGAGTLIPAFADCGAKLKTIASSTGISGTHIGGKYGFEESTTDSDLIFNNSQINTVVISTQHNSHAGFVLKAIEAGKNIFVEKPLCMSFQELKAIEKAWQKNPVRVMVGYNRRFSPLIDNCKDFISTNNCACSIIMTINAGEIPKEHWTQDIESGGGRIIGEACHFIDLSRYLVDSQITSINSIAMQPTSDEIVSDTQSISIGFKNGSIAIVHYFANGSKSFAKERIEIFSSGGILQLDNFKKLTAYGAGQKYNNTLWSQDKGQKQCIKAFVDSIKNGADCPISFEQTLEVARYTLLAAGKQEEV